MVCMLPPPPPFKNSGKSTEFDGNNTDCCSGKGVVRAYREGAFSHSARTAQAQRQLLSCLFREHP